MGTLQVVPRPIQRLILMIIFISGRRKYLIEL